MYVCVEDSSDHFKIDANSGEIRTTRVLSHDYGPSYRMTVIASDQGVPPLQGQAVINIQVIAHITQSGGKCSERFFLLYTNVYSENTLKIWILPLKSVADICVHYIKWLYYHMRNDYI